MKLLEAVQRAEARRRAMPTGEAVGLVWSEDEREPGPGEVCDIIRTEPDEGTPERWIYRPRAARGPEDLGDVFDAAGVQVGRVARIAGSLVSIEPVTLAAGAGALGGAKSPRRRTPGRQAKRETAQGGAS